MIRKAAIALVGPRPLGMRELGEDCRAGCRLCSAPPGHADRRSRDHPGMTATASSRLRTLAAASTLMPGATSAWLIMKAPQPPGR